MILRAEEGFTLIESMVAVLVVSFGMLAMGNLLITAIRVNHTNEVRLEASALAQSTMAYYIAQVKKQAAGAPALDFAGGDTLPPTLASAPDTFTPTVVFIPASTAECLFTNIQVKLTWSAYGKDKSVVIRSGVIKPKVDGCQL